MVGDIESPIYHLYTTYSPCLLGDYMLPSPPFTWEPETTIEVWTSMWILWPRDPQNLRHTLNTPPEKLTVGHPTSWKWGYSEITPINLGFFHPSYPFIYKAIYRGYKTPFTTESGGPPLSVFGPSERHPLLSHPNAAVSCRGVWITFCNRRVPQGRASIQWRRVNISYTIDEPQKKPRILSRSMVV